MKIDMNDPRITAFALGELTGDDAIEIACAVQSDERIREAVDEVRDTSFVLLESLSGGEAPMLTSAQRVAIRRAGPVITDIASARVSVWKKPLLAGVGVAAAIALALYMVGDRPVIHDMDHTADADVKAGWDWSQVDLQDLTAPAEWRVNEGVAENHVSESTHAVAAAVRDDTASFRKEVDRRIDQSELKLVSQLPGNQENDWMEVDTPLRLNVPMATGAASWSWLRRYIDENRALPPRQSVRVEEMVNHFQYKTPDMLTGDTLTGDMEICNTPWNPETSLLAVHIAARPHANLDLEKPTIALNSERVRRVRLLGYAQVKDALHVRPSAVNARYISKSQGNYVIYELELTGFSGSQEALATLGLNDDIRLAKSRLESWRDVSPDMRFASMVAATGMMLASNQSLGDLDANSLQGIVQAVEQQDGATLTAERRDAIELIKQVISIAHESSGGKKVE